jgi:hypothetical protein
MAVSIDAQAAINEIAAELAVRDKETEIKETAELESKAFWGGVDWSGIDKFINDFKLQSQNSIASGVADEAAKAWKESDISLEGIGNWLGEAYYDTGYPVLAVGDTALALSSGLLNMTGSAFSALPTMLTSDDPLTKKGSKEWRDKLVGTSKALEPFTYEAKTPFGKSTIEKFGGMFELFNEKVAFPVGDAAGWVAKNILDMDQKSSERVSASVVGVLTGASGALSVFRVKGKESKPLSTEGYSTQAIANARTNAIANVQSGTYLASMWKTIDPTGYAKAVKDRTALGKVAEAAKEMSKVIDETPVNLVRPEEIGHLGELKRDIRDYKDPALKGLKLGSNEFWKASKKYDVNMAPIMMDRVKANELQNAGSLEVLGHEFSHLQDALNYDLLVPERNPKDPATPTVGDPGTGNVNPAHPLGLPWSKDFWGMGSEGMPAVRMLSNILEEGIAKKDLETKFTNPTEIHSRLVNMQRALSEKNIDFLDIIDKDKTSDAVWIEKVYEMPYDVMQLVNKIDQAVERGVISKKAVQEMLEEALTESMVYQPTEYSLGIIGM